MNSKELAVLREINQYFIRIHNALSEGSLVKAAMAISSTHVAIGLLYDGLRKQNVKVSDDFMLEINAHQKELTRYIHELARLKAENPHYNRPVEHLYNVLIELPERQARSYRILLLPEELAAVEKHLGNPPVIAYSIEDITREAVGFEEFMATLKGEGSTGAYFPPDASQIPYYVRVSYKPRFFGLLKGETTESYVWMSLEDEAEMNRFLASDPELADFTVLDHNPNVDRDGLAKAFRELGI